MNNPPACNTGGNYPSPLPQTSVLIDWVSVTFPGSAVGEQGAFLKAVRRLFDGTVTTFKSRPQGLHGYRCSAVSDVGGVMVAWGGNADTVFLQLPGDACARVTDWHVMADFIAHRAGHLTRCDLAFDDLAGVNSLAHAVSLYQAGAFRMALGGRQPSASTAGNWLDQADTAGRTLYVGKAKNGKMLRVYQKGKQLGDPASPWVRWEAQLTDRDRVLPLAMLTDPAGFFRGAYPALAFVQGEACRIATRKAQERISVEKLTRHCREAYGPLLDVLVRSGASAAQVIERVRRDALPRRLHAPTDEQLRDRCHVLLAEVLADEYDDALRHG